MFRGRNLRESRRGRQILFIALRGSPFFPIDNQLELLWSEALVVAEISEALHRAPGGHAAGEGFLPDRLRPRPRFRIGGQGESGSTFAMAGDAASVQQAHYFAVERDL